MITLFLMIGLFIVTLSFVLYKRKALLMLRALFSTRYLQQLLREGKLTKESLYLYSILLYLVTFPCLIIGLFQFYPPLFVETYSLQPWHLYGIVFGVLTAALIFSQFFLSFFASIFNYQEERYLYTAIKTLFRFYNGIFLVSIIPLIWYARIPELFFFVYIPIFILILFAFFFLFLRNINGMSRIHFFIYFCSLEILPYLLIAKLLIINL